MRVRLLVLLLTASWVSCARQQTVVSEVPAVPIPAQMVRFEHVFVVVEENQNYEEVALDTDLADIYPGEVAGDNIASVLTANGKTWKAYAESIPRAGYVGDDHFSYVKRHNPFRILKASVRTRVQNPAHQPDPSDRLWQERSSASPGVDPRQERSR